jgi:FkbM family methyltransferase
LIVYPPADDAMQIGDAALFRRVIRRTIRALGYDLRQKRPELIEFLKDRKINLVLDVGANAGQFGAALRADGYSGAIISFEPAGVPFQELLQRTTDDGRWIAHKVALGDCRGRVKLNVSRSHTFSSVLSQTPNAFAFERNSVVDHVEEVDVARLDDVCEIKPQDRVFLKVDTQGFEEQVLNGARVTLSSVLGVLLELPLVHMYEQVWSFEQALRFMDSAGFVLAQIQPVNFLWRQDPVSVSELDCVFRRKTEALDKPV